VCTANPECAENDEVGPLCPCPVLGALLGASRVAGRLRLHRESRMRIEILYLGFAVPSVRWMRLRRTAAWVIFVALVLAGCSSSGDGTTVSSVSEITTTASAPTTTATTVAAT